MEKPILIVVVLTLLTLAVFIFLWWRNNKKQGKLFQTRHDEVLNAIAALKASLDNHAQSFAASAKDLTLNYETQNKQVIEQLKTENAQFKISLTENHKQALKKLEDEFNGLKNENKQFKSSLNESHEQALKKINEELAKILNEIKSPLNVD